jgi:hypothetical protein
MADATVTRLLKIEARIRGSEREGVQARWDSGRELLAARQGKKLPPRLLEEVGINRWEAAYRMRFAEACSEEEIVGRVQQSWREVIASLPKKQASPRKPPKPHVEPTKADVQAADRIERDLAKPAVIHRPPDGQRPPCPKWRPKPPPT